MGRERKTVEDYIRNYFDYLVKNRVPRDEGGRMCHIRDFVHHSKSKSADPSKMNRIRTAWSKNDYNLRSDYQQYYDQVNKTTHTQF
jgi:hypothetical protein